jgi:parallel beta-helix repeat protein
LGQTLPRDGPINVTKLNTYFAGWANATPNDDSNDTPAIRAVVAYLKANPGINNRTLYFPSGRYNFYSIPDSEQTQILFNGHIVSVIGDGVQSELVLGKDTGASSAIAGTATLFVAYSSANIEFRNLTLRCVRAEAASSVPRAVFALGMTNFRMSGVHVRGFLSTDAGSANPGAVVVGPKAWAPIVTSKEIKIDNCTFSQNDCPIGGRATSDIIIEAGCRNVILSGNHFTSANDIGINLQTQGQAGFIERGNQGNYIIQNNVITGKHRHGVTLTYSQPESGPIPDFGNTLISGNVISDNGYTGIYQYEVYASTPPSEFSELGSLVINGNVIENNGISGTQDSNRAGIYIMGRRGATSITANTVTKSTFNITTNGGRAGIFVEGCEQVSIVGNTVDKSRGAGILVSSAVSVNVSGNTLIGNCWGVGGTGFNEDNHTHLAVKGSTYMPRDITIANNIITSEIAPNRENEFLTGILVGPGPSGGTTNSFLSITGNSITGTRATPPATTSQVDVGNTLSNGIWTRGPVTGQIKNNIIRNFARGVTMGSESGNKNFPAGTVTPTAKLPITTADNSTWNVGNALVDERP